LNLGLPDERRKCVDFCAASEAEAAKVRAENEKAMKALAKEQADVDAVNAQLHEAEEKLQGGPKVSNT